MRKSTLQPLFIAAIAVQLSCTPVSHVGTLRESQDDFTRISNELTKSTVGAIVPVSVTPGSADASVEGQLGDLRDMQSTLQRSTNSEMERRAFIDYRAVAKNLADLNKNTEHSLRADNLYGVSMTLQVLAEWKAAFYQHLLRFDAAQRRATPTSLEESVALAAVVEKAGATMQQLQLAQVPLYPRDRFFLRSMKPLVRYDTAYLWAVRWNREGHLRVSTPTSRSGVAPADRKKICGYAVKIAEQMAAAEKELAAIKFKTDAMHITRFVVIQRYTMLRTATLILQDMKVNRTNAGSGWAAAEALALTPILAEQSRLFVQAWGKDGSAVRTAMASLGLTNTALLGGYYDDASRQANGMNWEGLPTMTQDDKTVLDRARFMSSSEPRQAIRSALMTPVP